MELCLSTPRPGPVHTSSHEPSHLGQFRVWLWLHQKVQGPGHELGREPEKRTEALGQGGRGQVMKTVGAAPGTHLAAWTWAHKEGQGGLYSYWKAEPSRCLSGGS